MGVIRDKIVENQVLHHLLNDPGVLSHTDKYILSPTDFKDPANRVLFFAINELFRSGCSTITCDDLMTVADSNDFFSQFKKDSYMQGIAELIAADSTDGFDYCYNKLKKLNLLEDLEKNGFDTSDFLMSDDAFDLDNKKLTKINTEFDRREPQDIIDAIRDKLLKLEKKYLTTSEISTTSAVTGLEDLIASFGQQGDLGLQIQGMYQNRIINGARLGTLTIRSAASGAGKTRMAVADACYLAYPIRWEDGHWAVHGHSEKVLMIVTEQTPAEIQRMVLAYLSGITESDFRYRELTGDLKKRLEVAVKIMSAFKDNFIITRMPEPNVDSIKNRIREEVRQNGCQYVFFDYIQVSPSLYKEFSGNNLRTDEALLLMTTALKDIAVELNVAVFSATQLNASGDNNGSNNIKNEASLAGARSIINKADNGLIMMRLTEEQQQKADAMGLEYKGQSVNRIVDVFKVRSGDYGQVRIWTYFDAGVLRYYDVAVTDNLGNIVQIDNFDSFEQLTKEEQIEYKNWIKENTI